MPRRHGRHSRPETSLYLPLAQTVQATAPAKLDQPAGHSLHGAFVAGTTPKRPAAHEAKLHSLPKALHSMKDPWGTTTEALPPARTSVPSAARTHDDEADASWRKPLGQAAQVAAPGADAKVPGLQGRHEADPLDG